MAPSDQPALERGYVFEWKSGSCTSSPMTTIQELRFHLQQKNTGGPPKVIVLPGYIDNELDRQLNACGIPQEFRDGISEVHPYRPSGCRPQDDNAATYSWKIPQEACWCGRCTDKQPAYQVSAEPVMLINVSLLLESSIAVLLVQRLDTECWRDASTLEEAFETQLQQSLPAAGLNVAIEDYINQLAYERWVAFMAKVYIQFTPVDLIVEAMGAIELNLDQARYMAARGKSVYVANEQAWEDILRRLERRLSIYPPRNTRTSR